MNNSRQKITPEATSQIIKLIYDAAIDANQWSNVLERIASLFKAHGGILRYINSNPDGQHFGNQYGYEKAYIEQYNDYYCQFDNINTRLKGLEGKCINIAYEEASDWFSTCDPLYYEFFNQYDIYNLLGANIMENQHGHFVLGMHRSLQAGSFSDDDVALFDIFTPHIKNAIQIQNKLHEHQQQTQAGYDALDYLPFGLIFLDANKKPIWNNKRADEIISIRKSLQINSNKISCRHPSESRNLSRLIDDALRHNQYQGGQMMLKDETGNLTLFVVPLGVEHHQYSAIADKARVVIFLGDTSLERKTPKDVLQVLYALTPAEARLVNGLCEGLTIQEMEKAYCLKASTLRSQLKSVFQKTGTSRQAEVVALVMSGPAMLNIE